MRFKAIFIRVIKELLRDKRTLALMLLAPILVLTLMYFIFDTNNKTNIKMGMDESVSNEIVNAVPSDKVDIEKYDAPSSIKDTIVDSELDAYIEQKGSNLEVTYKNEDSSLTGSTKQLLASAIQKNKMQDMTKIVEKIPDNIKHDNEQHSEALSTDSHYLYGDANSTFFDKIFPILIGFFVFFFVFLVSGIALLRERTRGTLERVLATSVKRSEIVFGYLAGYGLFAILQTLIIVLYSIYLLKVEIVGSIWWVLLINILIALSALAIGLFVSTFANSEFQMVQFIPLVVIPQVFFSGLIPLDSIANWVSAIGYILPLRYAGDALTNVMIKGQGFEFIWFDIAILLLFIFIFTILNIIGLKRYRKV
ncbi:ABC transporter permease [Staphylococcus sp. NAM3COL9]|uniref:ABC transporter permease n=1 Tax=Staphylococcus sp. NAM3COL9 TaxID=1667172 RepID=UPI000710A143|nr:ABC transporter permease [Staphylococcus sp. NAM3COL9]KRG08564.1 ABC transporter permease [Staphylococcus sp. NAM3COL9]